jgi:hypothetical protein
MRSTSPSLSFVHRMDPMERLTHRHCVFLWHMHMQTHAVMVFEALRGMKSSSDIEREKVSCFSEAFWAYMDREFEDALMYLQEYDMIRAQEESERRKRRCNAARASLAAGALPSADVSSLGKRKGVTDVFGIKQTGGTELPEIHLEVKLASPKTPPPAPMDTTATSPARSLRPSRSARPPPPSSSAPSTTQLPPPPDLAAENLRKLCLHYIEQPPAASWTGVNVMTSK